MAGLLRDLVVQVASAWQPSHLHELRSAGSTLPFHAFHRVARCPPPSGVDLLRSLQPGIHSVRGTEWVAFIVVGHGPIRGSEHGVLLLIREGEEDHVDDFSHEDPLAAAFLFPVGDVCEAAAPGGDLHALEPRSGAREVDEMDACVAGDIWCGGTGQPPGG